MSDVRITGGCQCGAIRYALHAAPTGASICHCRMCQKAFGNYFAPLAGVPLADFEVTRGTIAWFKSSDEVERGFCHDCGTPLIFHYADSERRISISLGSLDDPAATHHRHQSRREVGDQRSTLAKARVQEHTHVSHFERNLVDDDSQRSRQADGQTDHKADADDGAVDKVFKGIAKYDQPTRRSRTACCIELAIPVGWGEITLGGGLVGARLTF